MADVNANIGINIDTSQSLSEIKALQRQLAQLYTSINKGSAAAAAAQKGLATNLMNTVNAGGKFYAQMGTIRTSTESFTHALEKNKLTMREYFRFAGGSTRTFGKLFKSEFDTIGKVAEERVKRMQTQYIKLGRDASGAMKAISVTPTTLNMKEYGNQVAVAAQKQAVLNQLLKQGSTNLLNFGKNTQWAGRQLMVGFTIPLAYFGTAAAKTFMDLEAQAIRFKRVYGDMFTTSEQTNKALQEVQALAEEFTKYGVAVTKTMEMAANAAAMGKTGAELTAQVAEATRLAVLGGVEQQQALDTTISLTNAFGIAAEDLTSKINFLNAVENQTVTAIEDLTIAIPKAGPVIQQLGGSVEDLAFFLTAMREGGINASEGANALKSGLASLINPTDKAAKMLNGLGINIKAIVEGNVGNLRQTVIDFAKALDTLAPLERARAIEQLFGKFQFARLSTLFQNVTKDGTQAARVLELAGKSVEELAILSERELKTVEDAIGTNFRAAVEQLKVAIIPIGKEFLKAITPVVRFLGDLLDKFNNLGDGTKKFIVILTSFVGLIGPTLIMTFGLILNGVAQIIKLFTTMRQGFLKLTGNTTNLAQQTQYLNSEQMESAIVAASLNQAHTQLTQQFRLEASAVAALRDAYISATTAATRFAATNPGMMIPGFRGAKGGGTQRFSSGTTKVVGGESGKDSVPALLTPGEAVVPEPIAQDNKYKPLVEALVTGKIRKYNEGTPSVGNDGSIRFNGRSYFVNKQSTRDNLIRKIIADIELAKRPGGVGESEAIRVISNRMQSLSDRGQSLTASRVFKHISGGVTTSTGARASNRAIAPLRGAINRQYSAAQANELRVLQQRLRDAGLNENQIRNFVKSTEAHILNPQNTGLKWSSGQVLDDYFGLNNYLNRAGGQSIGSALSSIAADSNKYRALGYSEKQIRQLMYDHEFAKLKKHPTSYKELQSLGRIADFEQRLLQSPVIRQIGPGVRSDFIAQRHQAVGIGALLSVREPKYYKGLHRRLIQLGQGTASRVRRGQEEKVSKQERSAIARRTGQVISQQPGLKVPSGARVVGGKASDTVLAAKTPGEVTLTKKSASALRSGKSVNIPRFGRLRLAGFADGDPSGQMTLSQAQIRAAKEGTSVKEAKRRNAADIKAAKATERFTEQTKANEKQARNLGQKFTAGANVFSGLTIAASFMGGKVGEVAQKLAPLAIGLSTVAMLLPGLKAGILKFGAFLIANPFVAAGLAIAGLAVAAKVLDEKMKKQARAQSDYIDAISATTEKMKSVGEITGRVGAAEIMARRRQGATADRFTTGFDRAGQQFGTTFLESDIGKNILNTFQNSLVKGGTNAVKQIALELSSYVSDGLMTAEEANSVARAIGINMSNMSISANIQGEIRSIIGPNGEDLSKDPLKVRLEIVKESQKNINNYLSALTKEIPKIEVGKGDKKFAREIIASGAASGVQTLETLQAQRDAQAKLTLDKIRDLEAEKAKTADKTKQAAIEKQISDLRTKQASDDKALAGQRTKIIQDQLNLFKESQKFGKTIFGGRGETTFFEAAKQQVKTKFEGDPFAQKFIDVAADLKSKELEVQILTTVGSGDLTPQAAINFIEQFKGNEAQLSVVLNSKVALENPDKFAQLQNIVSGFKGKNKQVGIEITTALTAEGEEGKFDDRLAALTMLQTMDGKEINLAAYLKGDAKNKLDQLVPLLNKVESLSGPITTTVIQDLQQSPEMKAQGVNFAGLVADWEHYINLPAEEQKTAIQTYVSIYKTIGAKEKEQFARNKAGGATSGTIYDFWMGQSESAIAAELNKELYAQGTPQLPSKVKGDDLRSGPAKESPFAGLLDTLKRVRDASINAAGGAAELMRVLGKSKDLVAFKGIDQQLTKLGANRGFIDFVGGVEKAVRDKLITINKKGVVSFTQLGKAANKAFNEIALGNFVAETKIAIQEQKNQQIAFIKLTSAGVSAKNALDMVADASFATAIAGAKNAKEINKVVKAYLELQRVTKETQQITDPEGAFNDAMSEAMKYYDALEYQARQKYQPAIDAANELIDAEEKRIETLQNFADINYDRPIQRLQEAAGRLNNDLTIMDKSADAINKKYDKQAEVLENIQKINSRVAEQEKSKISLADALTQGDIAAAAQAAQQITEQNAQFAAEDAAQLLQINREQELNALRSAAGLTREQIEQKLYEISQQTYALEQQRLVIDQRIQAAQDEIYRIREGQLKQAEDALKKELKLIDDQRKAWDDAKNQLDLYNGSLNMSKKTAQELLDAILGLNTTVTTTHIIETIRIGGGGGGGGGGGQNNTSSDTRDSHQAAEFIGTPFGQAGSSSYSTNLGNRPLGTSTPTPTYSTNLGNRPLGFKMYGGIIKKMATGGVVPGIGMTDKVPSLLTPGEFVVKKSSAQAFLPMLQRINESVYPAMLRDKIASPVYNVYVPNNILSMPTNNGSASINDNSNTVYNYNVGITVGGNDANPNRIAKAVLDEIKYIDSQRIRNQRA